MTINALFKKKSTQLQKIDFCGKMYNLTFIWNGTCWKKIVKETEFCVQKEKNITVTICVLFILNK